MAHRIARAQTRIIALAAAAATAAVILLPSPANAAGNGEPQSPSDKIVEPTLVARATLSADHIEPGPASGALASPANGRSGPFPGQVVPGFSAMIDNGDGTFWAQPDNGFGSKANSADFLLRNYLCAPIGKPPTAATERSRSSASSPTTTRTTCSTSRS
jgi:glycerophosphoryl diester phosphodiesterase